MKLRMSITHRLFLLGAFALLVAPTSANAVIEWVAIGDHGNPDDTQPQGSFGGVDYDYSISKFETTNAEYAAFLNAKAASDPLGLYDPSMGSDIHGGITRSGTPASFTYATKTGFENEAVNFVTFFDALRYANWVGNGEGNGDTETGAYTLLGGTETPSNESSVVRNPGATVVVPIQDEWFKAAYYDGAGGVYYDYPMGTDDVPTCTSPKADPNSANCGNSAIRGVTEVGAYTGSPSPYGTFDQGGNVAEWNENTAFGGGRAVRGGGWTGLTTPLRASSVGSWAATTDNSSLGFRLVLLDSGGGSLDITEIKVSKLVDRFDGMLSGDPYLFEACVSGTGIVVAEVTPPGGSPVQLFPFPEGQHCIVDFFADAAALDLAYPNGSYDFFIFGNGGATDSKTLDLQATEPGGYLEIASPIDGAEVPADQDLIYTWSLAEKSNGIGCIAGMSCADEIAVEIDEFSMTGFMTIVEDELPITATGTVLPASELEVDSFYESAIGTSTGTSNLGDTTDMGDPTETRAVYLDINRVSVIAVPEPAAGLLIGIPALLTMVRVRRARVGRTR